MGVGVGLGSYLDGHVRPTSAALQHAGLSEREESGSCNGNFIGQDQDSWDPGLKYQAQSPRSLRTLVGGGGDCLAPPWPGGTRPRGSGVCA